MTVAVSLQEGIPEQMEKLNIQLDKMRDLAKQAVTDPVRISSIDWGDANVTIGNGGTGSATGTVWNTASLPSLTGSVLGSGVYYTNNTGGYTLGAAPTQTIVKSGQVELEGKDADIRINGKSMSAWMEKVEERLNILTPNPELEKEWDDLRRLGERYRKLEKKCQEKTQMWEALKKLPKVKV